MRWLNIIPPLPPLFLAFLGGPFPLSFLPPSDPLLPPSFLSFSLSSSSLSAPLFLVGFLNVNLAPCRSAGDRSPSPFSSPLFLSSSSRRKAKAAWLLLALSSRSVSLRLYLVYLSGFFLKSGTRPPPLPPPLCHLGEGRLKPSSSPPPRSSSLRPRSRKAANLSTWNWIRQSQTRNYICKKEVDKEKK